MKRLILLTIGLALIVSLQFVLNCARPLESIDPYDPAPPSPPGRIVDTIFQVDTLIFGSDTLIIVDTVFYGTDTLIMIDTIIVGTDTLIIVDTIVTGDTVFVTDTLVIVDTVVVVVEDSTGAFCGQMGASQKILVWMLQNESGSYKLEFAALAERDHPPQELTVIIDGTEFSWHPAQDMELIVERELDDDTVIKIRSEAPNAYGHAIDICLKVTEL